MTREPQFAFTGGEISTKLLGRIDTERYRSSLRLARNFVIRPQGGAEFRPGTQLVRAAKSATDPVILAPFVFSQAQSYVLEFGPGYIRIHSDGQTVLDPATGTPLEIPTPYVAADLAALRWFQSGDVLTLVHPAYEERELRRTSATTWQIAVVSNTPTQLPPTGLNLAQGLELAADSLEWEWVVTAVSSTGEESIASNVLSKNVKLDVVNRADKAKVAWSAPTGPAPMHYNVYRGRNGLHGFIGQAKDRVFFFDDNFAPVYSLTPPSGTDPFTGGNYPGTGTYFEQRKFLAGTIPNPINVYGSESSVFNSFRRSSPPQDTDSIQFPVKQPQIDRVSWLLGLDKALVIGTPSSIVSVRGEQETILTAVSIDQKEIDHHGASSLPPLRVGQTYLYQTFQGGAIREGAFEDLNIYRATDLSIMAEHLFRDHDVTAWCYAADPFSCVWARRSDGVLLGLSYHPEHQVWAWHQHTTQGTIESIAAVPENGGTSVYLAVQRSVGGVTRRLIERMGTTENLDPLLDLHLDSALSYDGRVTDGSTATTAGSTWTADSSITISTSTPRFAAGDVGSQVVFPYAAANGDDRELRCTITEVHSPVSVSARLEASAPATLQNATVTTWSIAARSFGGLSHLEGATVRACADGKSVGELVVSGGSVTLAQPASVVHVGLEFIGRLESLEISDFGAKKQIPGITLLLQNTRSVYVGERVARQLDEVAPRAFEDYFELSQGVLGAVDVTITTSTNRGCGVVVEAREPVACRVLGWIPRSESGRD